MNFNYGYNYDLNSAKVEKKTQEEEKKKEELKEEEKETKAIVVPESEAVTASANDVLASINKGVVKGANVEGGRGTQGVSEIQDCQTIGSLVNEYYELKQDYLDYINNPNPDPPGGAASQYPGMQHVFNPKVVLPMLIGMLNKLDEIFGHHDFPQLPFETQQELLSDRNEWYNMINDMFTSSSATAYNSSILGEYWDDPEGNQSMLTMFEELNQITGGAIPNNEWGMADLYVSQVEQISDTVETYSFMFSHQSMMQNFVYFKGKISDNQRIINRLSNILSTLPWNAGNPNSTGNAILTRATAQKERFTELLACAQDYYTQSNPKVKPGTPQNTQSAR